MGAQQIRVRVWPRTWSRSRSANEIPATRVLGRMSARGSGSSMTSQPPRGASVLRGLGSGEGSPASGSLRRQQRVIRSRLGRSRAVGDKVTGHRTWLKNTHPDAKPLSDHGQGLHEAPPRRTSRRTTHRRTAARPRPHAGDREDPATSGLAHRRQHSLGERDRAEVVDLELVPNLLHRELLGRSDRTTT